MVSKAGKRKTRSTKQTRRQQTPDNLVVHTSDSGEEDRQDARLRSVRERFSEMMSFWSEIHAEGLEDDQFVAGKQWPDKIRQEREEDGRPVLTYNLLPGFTRQIINKVRQERPQVRVKPVESDKHQTPDVTNVQGTKDYSLSDVYMGIIRNIEHLSRADHAYDTALQHAVHHGFGFFTCMPEYSRRNPFVQDLIIRRVKNSYSVMLDPSAQEADYSDAQDGFIFTSISRAAFELKYPDEQMASFDQASIGDTYAGWYTKEDLRIAQYFWMEYRADEVLLMNNGKVHWHSDVKEVLDDMERDRGILVDQRKPAKRPVCRWMKLTANSVLEGPRDLVFEQVPIFPVLGDEIILEGKTIYESAIRHAKDPQRSYNYWRTAAAETVALAPRAPWILTDKQISGHEDEWDSANTHNLPYLTYNHQEGVNPPQRTYPERVPAAEIQNATQDGIDMQTIIGLHDASLGREGNEKSGKAILARQSQGSTSTYTFPDNLNRALESLGRCLVRAIPRIYDSQRVVRIRMPDDTEDFVEINKVEIDSATGESHLVHDLGYGEYDVVVETGPSYATQRQEAVEVQLEMLRNLPPETAGAILHLIVKNMGLPGSDEMAAVLRKMVPDNLKSEDERAADLPKGVIFDDQGNAVHEDSGEPYEPPLSPQEKLKQEELAVSRQENEAKIADAEAKKVQAQAKIEEARAKQAEAESARTQGEGDQAVSLPAIEKIIRDVMREHEENPQAHTVAIADQQADAIVEALKRVRKYVDARVAGASAEEANNDEPRGGQGGRRVA